MARRRVINTGRYPTLARAVRELAARGRLRRVHPGVYVDSEAPLDLGLRALAAQSWLPEAVFTRFAAAKLALWPELEVDILELADPAGHPPQEGLRLSRRRVPRAMVEVDRGLRRTTVPLTVAELIPDLGSEIIVRAFRAGFQPHDIEAALNAAPRPGHLARRAVLAEHRDIPWSVAEQQLHIILREAGITGWRANRRVAVGDGDVKILDIVLEHLRIAIEVDGFEFHGDDRRDVFERDRYVASDLTARGWRVLRFTARQLFTNPEWVVAVIQATIALVRSPHHDAGSGNRAG